MRLIEDKIKFWKGVRSESIKYMLIALIPSVIVILMSGEDIDWNNLYSGHILALVIVAILVIGTIGLSIIAHIIIIKLQKRLLGSL